MVDDRNRKPRKPKQGAEAFFSRYQVTLVVLAAAALVFVWYVLADRHTPYTDQARIEALVVPIVPQVSGYVADVSVRLHSVVEPGEPLLRLDPRPFDRVLDRMPGHGDPGRIVESTSVRFG